MVERSGDDSEAAPSGGGATSSHFGNSEACGTSPSQETQGESFVGDFLGLKGCIYPSTEWHIATSTD